ncbi:MAG: hypothetical protein K0R69_2857 [Clostridia bacterium]|nr:hypothetical protein [Clostridia bacterium]
MNLDFLIGPAVGGIIGYITNGIAIKMLFRPLKPIYLGGMRLPFTPGIIPKEKGRMARSIGRVVGKDLINDEVLTKVLLQENIYRHIDERIENILQDYEQSQITIRDFCRQTAEEEHLERLKEQVSEAIVEKVYTKIVTIDLGKIAMENLANKIDKSVFGAFALFINDSLIENIAAKLAPMINEMVEKEGRALIADLVEKEGEELLDKPLYEIIEKMKDNIDIIKGLIRKSYTYFVQNHLSRALEVIDLSKVVEERINALDTLELEKVLLEIMSKELNAIIWLGALLGAILGCFMSLF